MLVSWLKVRLEPSVRTVFMNAAAAVRSGASHTTKTERNGSTAKLNLALFWHAIVRKNGTCICTLLSTLCGLSGSTEHQVSAALTRRESGLMYALLAELTSVDLGRATALLALVNPEAVLVTLIRGSTAVRDRALLVEQERPAHAKGPPTRNS